MDAWDDVERHRMTGDYPTAPRKPGEDDNITVKWRGATKATAYCLGALLVVAYAVAFILAAIYSHKPGSP